MAEIISLTGADTVTVAGRVLTDFGDGDNANLEFPNEKAAVKAGKNGNAIMAQNAMGQIGKLTLRLLRASEDDKFLNSLLALQDQDFSSFNVLDGQVVKRVGDGSGNVAQDTYLCSGGLFTKNVAAKQNSEGDTEQSLSIYEITYALVTRSIF